MEYLSKYTIRIIIPIMMLIAQIESNDNVDAIGDNGLAFGHLQIHAGCVQDVNKYFNTSYSHEDMKNRKCAEDVFIKYIAIGEDIHIKKYNKFPSEKDIVNMWNWGIYQRAKNNKYYERYKSKKNRNSGIKRN